MTASTNETLIDKKGKTKSVIYKWFGSASRGPRVSQQPPAASRGEETIRPLCLSPSQWPLLGGKAERRATSPPRLAAGGSVSQP